MNTLSKDTCAKLIARILASYGSEYVFGAPGTTELSLCNAISMEPGIQYVSCLHENVAIGMAEGVSRGGKSLGVANLHATQGTLNGMGSIRASHRNGSPLLVIAGFPATHYSIYEPNHFQYGLTDIVRHVTKWSWQIDDPLQVSTAIRRGIEIAQTPPKGPTFIGIPQNILESSISVSEVIRQNSYWSPPVSIPPDERLREAIEIIKKSRLTLIYSGNEVGRSGGKSVAYVGKLAECLNAVILGEAMDRGPMIQSVNSPVTHNLFAGFFDSRNPVMREIISSCDTLIEVGTRTTYEKVIGKLSPSTNIIQIDSDPHQLGKNHSIALGLSGDIEKTLERLNLLMDDDFKQSLRKEEIKSNELVIKSRKWISTTHQPTADFSMMLDLVRIISEEMPKNGVIVDDSQSFSYFIKNHFPFTTAGELHGSLASHLGWALPVALGLGISQKDKRIICFVGDGSFLFSVQALVTAKKYGIPVTIIVINNSGFKSLQVESEQKGWLDATQEILSLEFSKLKICDVAISLGIQAKRLSSGTELRTALHEGLKSEDTYLIEIEAPSSLDLWRKTWLVQ